MFRHSLQPKILLKNSLAALLVITISGAYGLFCCQAIKAAKTEQQTANIGGAGEHCHFSKNKDSETSEAAARINAYECCGLKFNFFIGKLEKNEFSKKTPALAKNVFSFFEPVKFQTIASFTDFPYRGPVFESRDLHVRNCVFRI